jgi:ATP-dependent Lhr-like helicase
MLDEKTGYSMIVREDPYHILLQNKNIINSEIIKEVLDELSKIDLNSLIIKAITKTGLFKRKIINVARKFGAIAKGVDFSNISLDQLTTTFQGTIIYQEAIKQIISQDIDVLNLNRFFTRLKKGEFEIIIVKRKDVSPLTRVSLEKFSRQRNLLSSEKKQRLAVASTKTRLLNEVRTFVCTCCWDYVQMTAIKKIDSMVTCPNCGSNRIGVLNKPIGVVKTIAVKKNKPLTIDEEKIVERAITTADFVANNGKRAVIVLAGKNLSFVDVEKILTQIKRIDDSLFRMIVEAERKALTQMFG